MTMRINAVTGTMQDDFDNSVYAHSFGRIPNKTVIFEGSAFPEMKGRVDIRPRINEAYKVGLKALLTTAGGAGTAGQALIPVYVDTKIVDQSRKFTPWTEIIQRVTNLGITADYNIITDKEDGFAAVEDANLDDATDTEDRASENIKYLYSVGRVSGPMQAAQPPYVLFGMQPQGSGLVNDAFSDINAPNGVQYEILKRSRALKELEETLLWNGNSTTSSQTQNANGTEFDGLISLQSTTNQTDKTGSVIAWGDVEKNAKEAFDDSGRPTVGGCGSSVYIDLRTILIDTFRLRPSDMGGGVTPSGIASRLTLETMVGPIQLIPSQFLTNTSGSKQLWFLDLDVVESRVLLDQTYERLAKNNDSEKFMLKEYMTLINRAPSFSAFLDNLT